MTDLIVNCVVKKHWKKLSKKKNVTGYSGVIRERIRNGKVIPGSKVFRVYVTKKENGISCKDLVPSTLELDVCDCGISTVETDIVEVGTIRYMDEVEEKTVPADHQKRIRPYMAGVSSTNQYSTACTMNVPYKKLSGLNSYKILISSNNHCYNRENDGQPGELILQPSPYDGGTPIVDEIGKLLFGVETKYNGFVCPIRNALVKFYRFVTRQESPINKVDISFAEPINVQEISYGVFGIEGRIVGKGKHTIGTTIIKSGRTTAVTEGTIIDEFWVGAVQGSRGTAMYQDCVLCQLQCAGGDSGSPIVSEDNTGNLLYHGALFAGSDAGITIYCKVENIEKEAEVELVVY